MTATVTIAVAPPQTSAQEAAPGEAAPDEAATTTETTETTETTTQSATTSANFAPSADDERARGLFEQGAAAYEAGHYDAALGFFEESYALSGRATLLFNIATSADRLRLNDKALENYDAYLEALPTAANSPEVTSRIRVLREELANQERLQNSLANLEEDAVVQRAARRRRRLIGGITGAVLLIGGAVLIGVLARGDRFDDYDSNVIQTLRSPL